MSRSLLMAALLGGMVCPVVAAPIGAYTQWVSYGLSGLSEASAITYSRDTDSLYAVGDEGAPIVRYSKAGQRLDQFSFNGPTGGPDTEGLTYLGNGRFMLADEKAQTGYVYTYVPNGSGTYTSTHVFGATTGNIGLEGVAYDPLTNSVWGVKETGPMAVYQMTNFGEAGQSVIVNPGAPQGLHPSRLGLNDLSDIYAMSASAAFLGTDRQWNLLILSQESNRIIEVNRQGVIQSSLDISFLGSNSIEGITMDDDGTLYLAAEGTLAGGGATLYVLNAVPEPSTYMLLGLAAFGIGMVVRKRRQT